MCGSSVPYSRKGREGGGRAALLYDFPDAWESRGLECVQRTLLGRVLTVCVGLCGWQAKDGAMGMMEQVAHFEPSMVEDAGCNSMQSRNQHLHMVSASALSQLVSSQITQRITKMPNLEFTLGRPGWHDHADSPPTELLLLKC